MTITTEWAELLERWPGFAEQSWQERFVELDRRYMALADRIAEGLSRTTSSPEAVGEAVAWLYEHAGSTGTHRVVVPLTERAQHMAKTGWTEIPLYRHPVAADREAIARLLCEQDGRDPDGGPRVGYGYVNYLSRADAILAALSPKGAGE